MMKGIVFREFLDMVDTAFSPVVTEQIIHEANLPSGGSYTSVGTYDHNEIISLVSALSQNTGKDVGELVYAFGFHLYGRFRENYPDFFDASSDTFQFLESVDNHIHVEVAKLYPNAELPRLDCERLNDNMLIVHYESGRAMGDLAQGLIVACIQDFGETIELNRVDLSAGPKQRVRFELKHTKR